MLSLFDPYYTPSIWHSGLPKTRAWSPRFECNTTDDGVTVTADLPGVKSEDLSITINAEGVLVVEGERKGHGSFTRRFVTSERIDEGSFKATLVDGVLTVSAAFVPKPEPRKIPVLLS